LKYFSSAQISFDQWVDVPVTQEVLIGGLRINTITNNDGISAANNILTSYSYLDNGGNSTAVLYSRPVYVQQIRNDLVQSVGYWTTNGFQSNSLNPNGCPVLGLYLKSGGSIRPMETTQGYHIGYSRVKVSQSGKASVFTITIQVPVLVLPMVMFVYEL
jgi:hypothetical protein